MTFALLLALAVMDPWSGRERHPAVVNPPVRAEDGTVLSLRGDWAFSKGLTNAPGLFLKSGTNGCWNVAVPGCWEASGVGEAALPDTYRCQDHGPKPIRHVWNGTGVYRKTVTVPPSWTNGAKRIWIAAGGIAAQGWISVNDRWNTNDSPAGYYNSYCGTCKWEITDRLRGKDEVRILVLADNTAPFRGGSQYFAMRFGGLYRDFELQVTPQVYIDDAWVRGDFDARAAEAHVDVAGGVPDGLRLRVTVGDETREVPAEEGENIVRLPLKDFRPWSPEHPNLYTARVELVANGAVTMTRRERFGVRKLEVVGKEFRLNGRPFFFRGCGDNHPYPETGCPPADRAYHLKHLKIAKQAGFNYIRLHTHCEVPEYFEAADELGILLQPELPYYGNAAEDPFEFDPVRDAAERRDNFRRHPSFAIASGGNEGTFAEATAKALYRTLKATDPDRLVIEQDGCDEMPDRSAGRSDYLGGPLVVWKRGAFNAHAFICHEYLNLTVKCDSRDEPEYADTLWLPPHTRANRAAWLAKSGLDLAWGDRFQDAAHVLQKTYQKMGIEWARMDPYCDGYCYWTVADTVVMNEKAGVYTAQGLFNPFWKTKRRGCSPEEFAAFNAPSVLCLDLTDNPSSFPADAYDEKTWRKIRPRPWGGGTWEDTNRVFTSGSTIPARFILSHYAEADLADATLVWTLEGPSGTLACGEKALGRVTTGPARTVAEVPVAVPATSVPYKATITANVGTAKNAWDVWVFPERARKDGARLFASGAARTALVGRYDVLAEDPAKAKVVIGFEGCDELKAAVARGCDTIELSNIETPANIKLGWWWIGKQAGTAIKPHAVLGDFPCGDVMEPLFFRILKEGKKLPVEGVTKDDIVIAGEGVDACYLYLAVVTSPAGGRRVLVSGLDLLSSTPEGAYLTDAILSFLTKEK